MYALDLPVLCQQQALHLRQALLPLLELLLSQGRQYHPRLKLPLLLKGLAELWKREARELMKSWRAVLLMRHTTVRKEVSPCCSQPVPSGPRQSRPPSRVFPAPMLLPAAISAPSSDCIVLLPQKAATAATEEWSQEKGLMKTAGLLPGG